MRFLLIGLSFLLGALPAYAGEAYPSKSVTIVVPYGAGNTADVIARLLGQRLAQQMGKPFVVDNRPGASGIVGNGAVAKAAPDGYMVSFADFTLLTAPALYKSVPWDPIKDFAPVTEVAHGAQVIAVSPDVPAKNMREFIALAKANPGKYNYGSAGTGSGSFLATELLKRNAGIDLVHVPYKGMAEASTGLLTGDVKVLIASVPVLNTLITSQKIRVLGVTSDGKRLSRLPDVPSLQEQGVSGMVYYAWFGMVAPAGTPPAVLSSLQTEVAKALSDKELSERLTSMGMDAIGSTPAQFAELIRNERTRWGEIIRVTGSANSLTQ